mgnify:CR=1 FL=1
MSGFTWTSLGGVDVTLPDLADLPAGVYRRHRNEDPAGFVFSVLEEMADEDTLAKVDDLPMTQVNDLFLAWQSRDGATVPQS